ncbi:MAG: sigma 54-interacting transcriptional regulator [Candidatus Cloacimonadales bacterium]|jgi:transcriptional regulator with PAS, ATPase and Fis domain|nr:sigma 54-interacting transcriptional regulator [Candidatus Cloacimonadota bacterium]MDD2650700.1 sigma 54-interacting transcriptional regulator [Candidatus Cloacimonadota bacterium]MDD3501666.1 sigma 54-interacting transcriptional regulator [Candidatus Cloacimonadota bacterium]MDX9978016.1 sigma 54-interacting transcriptional regulator [Candidatus Cloacimonadales bacterium]
MMNTVINTKINNLYDQANQYIKEKSFEKAEEVLNSLISLGQSEESLNAIAYAKLIQGVLLITRKNFNDGFINFHEALKLAENLEDQKLVQLIQIDLGKWYCEFNELDKAIDLMQNILKNNPDNTQALNIIAIAYARKHEHKKAIEYFKKKYELSKLQNDEQDCSVANSNIALCNISLENYDEAIKRLLEAFIIELKFNNKTRLANITNSLAIAYIKKNNYVEAYEFATKANTIAKEIDNLDEQERSWNSLYTIYRAKEEHEKAYQSIDKKLEIQTVRNQQILSQRIQDLEKLINYERNTHQQKELELLKNKESFRVKYEHFQSAYKELLDIGDVGIFSDKIKNIFEMAYFFHKDRAVSVLIEGETGTGKEIIARVVHFGKDDDVHPFISINCSAISPNLFESELFGYEDGAFTGARPGGMIGKLELAQGGTIFLDEIGEMPIELQAKLLRVIQQREYYKVGGQKPIKLDVRIICATNRDLKVEMENKRFRPDLFYRLSTGRIFIPPLRERKEEIAPLAQMFMVRFSEEKKKKFQFIDNEVMKFFEEYNWPGNIRELQNTIERIVILNDDKIIKIEHLSFFNTNHQEQINSDQAYIQIELPEEGIDLKETQREIMRQILKRFNGNKTQAAKYLGIARKTLYENEIE